MNLYKISQTVNNDYDTFSSAVVSAINEEEARSIHPGGPHSIRNMGLDWYRRSVAAEWAGRGHIKVELIGVATSDIQAGHVYCSSYHAG